MIERRSQEWMAAQEGCGKATINRDVQWVLAQVYASTVANALDAKRMETHILDHAERDLLDELKLLEPVDVTSLPATDDPKMIRVRTLNHLGRVETKLKVQDRILGLQERRAKLWNLDAPLPPVDEEAPDVQPPETDSAAVEAATAAYETAILQTYPAQRVGLVPELSPDGDPSDEGGDPA